MQDVVEVLSIRRYKAGYEVRQETWLSHFEDEAEGHTILMREAYNPSGDYIGDPKFAFYLCQKMGIQPEKANLSHSICSIGFCPSKQKWYGWSHRAIYGFGIGDIVKKGDCAASSGWTDEYLREHPEKDSSLPVGFTAHTLEDAKKMALAFAASVS